jgi:hypothetical protein
MDGPAERSSPPGCARPLGHRSKGPTWAAGPRPRQATHSVADKGRNGPRSSHRTPCPACAGPVRPPRGRTAGADSARRRGRIHRDEAVPLAGQDRDDAKALVDVLARRARRSASRGQIDMRGLATPMTGVRRRGRARRLLGTCRRLLGPVALPLTAHSETLDEFTRRRAAGYEGEPRLHPHREPRRGLPRAARGARTPVIVRAGWPGPRCPTSLTNRTRDGRAAVDPEAEAGRRRTARVSPDARPRPSRRGGARLGGWTGGRSRRSTRRPYR